MTLITTAPSLVEQVYRAIMGEISAGKLRSGERIIQEQLAQDLGVSRQPVQQALLLLRNHGILRDAPGRGLLVAPLDLDHVHQLYEMRAVVEGLAFRLAADSRDNQGKRRGQNLIRNGRKAVKAGSVSAMVNADIAFHDFVYSLSGNALIAPVMETHWAYAQRVMGEVVMREDKPRDIWDQHEALLDTIIAGDAQLAETMARTHIIEAAEFMISRLSETMTTEAGD